MFDGCIVILLARLLTLKAKLDVLAEAVSPALLTMIGNDWKAGYELFIEKSSDVDSSAKEKFRLSAEEYDSLTRVLYERTESPAAVRSAIQSCSAFRRIVDRERPKKLEALLENQILDAHFLPVLRPSEPLSEGKGYVILFRQILALPGNIIQSLASGVSSLDDVSAEARVQAAEVLECPSGIMANVASPHVEHILQRFSNVFARVGVTDCSKRYRDWLVRTTCEGPSL